MNHTLPRVKAIEVAEFIDKTNYCVFDADEGAFESLEDAITFINSDKYDPDIPLAVIFNTARGDYHDDARISYEDGSWAAYDLSMGGKTAFGETIQDALVNFRLEHDSSCEYYPEELIINTPEES
jgi:hypothetical protein